MENKKLNRCMFTSTYINKNKNPLTGELIEETIQIQCDKLTDKQPNPSNNNRVYCDSCQEIVDKINKEKFKGYVKISELKNHLLNINNLPTNQGYFSYNQLLNYLEQLEQGEFE